MFKDECDQTVQDQMNSNQGFGLKKKGVGKKECEQETGSIFCATRKSKQRTKVKATKSGGKCIS